MGNYTVCVCLPPLLFCFFYTPKRITDINGYNISCPRHCIFPTKQVLSQKPTCSFVVLQWKLSSLPQSKLKVNYVISNIGPCLNFLSPFQYFYQKTMKHFVVDELPKSNISLALLQYRQNNQTYVAPYLSRLQIGGYQSQTSMLKSHQILTNVLCINKVFSWRLFLNSRASSYSSGN